MADAPALQAPGARCGIDSVEIARIERLLRDTPPEDLAKLFSPDELHESADSGGRAASLAARFAAKEACLKLFPRETALNLITAADFSVARDAYGAPRVVCSPAAQAVLGRHRIAQIALSLTHDRASASAVALADPAHMPVPLAGKLLYHFFPLRRGVVLDNLRRVYGASVPEDEILRIAQAHYAHLWRLLPEFIAFPWLTPAQRAARARVENQDAIVAAHARGKGVIIVTGHFGNWEVSTAAGIANFPQARGRFYFVRRPFKPAWLDAPGHQRNAAQVGANGGVAALGGLIALLGNPALGLAIVSCSLAAAAADTIAWFANPGTHLFDDGFDSDADKGCWSSAVP